MSESFKTVDSFKLHWSLWKVIGLIPPQSTNRYSHISYTVYSFLFNSIVSIYYPTHLIIGLIHLCTTKGDLFKNLSINVTCIACTIKVLIYWSKLGAVRKTEKIFSKLDERIDRSDSNQRKYFATMAKNVKLLLFLFAFVYGSAFVASEVAVIVSVERRLLYPAWFPFGWTESTFNYSAAHIYQMLGILFQIFQNFTSDSYPPVCLALLSGHIHLLAMRISQIGTNPDRSNEQNNIELQHCIEDHKLIIDAYYTIQDTISIVMFIQFVVYGFTVCVTLIFLMFFANDIFTLVYYILFVLAIPFEIFPCCYYGSAFEFEFGQLHRAIYMCNWIEQDRKFIRSMLIFNERSLCVTTMYAFGIFKIHIDTFFTTCKSAYSLFAVVMRAK